MAKKYNGINRQIFTHALRLICYAWKRAEPKSTGSRNASQAMQAVTAADENRKESARRIAFNLWKERNVYPSEAEMTGARTTWHRVRKSTSQHEPGTEPRLNLCDQINATRRSFALWATLAHCAQRDFVLHPYRIHVGGSTSSGDIKLGADTGFQPLRQHTDAYQLLTYDAMKEECERQGIPTPKNWNRGVPALECCQQNGTAIVLPLTRDRLTGTSDMIELPNGHSEIIRFTIARMKVNSDQKQRLRDHARQQRKRDEDHEEVDEPETSHQWKDFCRPWKVQWHRHATPRTRPDETALNDELGDSRAFNNRHRLDPDLHHYSPAYERSEEHWSSHRIQTGFGTRARAPRSDSGDVVQMNVNGEMLEVQLSRFRRCQQIEPALRKKQTANHSTPKEERQPRRNGVRFGGMPAGSLFDESVHMEPADRTDDACSTEPNLNPMEFPARAYGQSKTQRLDLVAPHVSWNRAQVEEDEDMSTSATQTDQPTVHTNDPEPESDGLKEEPKAGVQQAGLAPLREEERQMGTHWLNGVRTKTNSGEYPVQRDLGADNDIYREGFSASMWPPLPRGRLQEETAAGAKHRQQTLEKLQVNRTWTAHKPSDQRAQLGLVCLLADRTQCEEDARLLHQARIPPVETSTDPHVTQAHPPNRGKLFASVAAAGTVRGDGRKRFGIDDGTTYHQPGTGPHRRRTTTQDQHHQLDGTTPMRNIQLDNQFNHQPTFDLATQGLINEGDGLTNEEKDTKDFWICNRCHGLQARSLLFNEHQRRLNPKHERLHMRSCPWCLQYYTMNMKFGASEHCVNSHYQTQAEAGDVGITEALRKDDSSLSNDASWRCSDCGEENNVAARLRLIRMGRAFGNATLEMNRSCQSCGAPSPGLEQSIASLLAHDRRRESTAEQLREIGVLRLCIRKSTQGLTNELTAAAAKYLEPKPQATEATHDDAGQTRGNHGDNEGAGVGNCFNRIVPLTKRQWELRQLTVNRQFDKPNLQEGQFGLSARSEMYHLYSNRIREQQVARAHESTLRQGRLQQRRRFLAQNQNSVPRHHRLRWDGGPDPRTHS